MRRCVNDPAWAVETAQATGMCEACPGCTAQAQKDEKDRWNLGFFCMGNGITVCNRVGVGSEWPMVAHIRYNREVNLVELLAKQNVTFGTYLWVPDYNGLDDYIWEFCMNKGNPPK